MVDNKDKQESVPVPEKRMATPDESVRFDWDKEKKHEQKEISEGDKIALTELRREIEKMELDDNLKKQAEEKLNKISFLADDDKLKNLLQLAKEKGVVFAIKVAKSMNDPFLLDTLHDALAQLGYYQKFIK